MLAIALVLPAPAAAQQRLSPVSPGTVSATFEPTRGDQKAELAVSVRNDSRYRGSLRVRLVYDDGTTVRARRKHVVIRVDKQRINVWLGRRGKRKLRIGPRDVKRIKVQAWADELPKTALSGTLIVATPKPGRVSPLTVPVKLSPPAETPAASVWHEATVKPETIVMTVKRWWPAPFNNDDELRVASEKVRVDGAKVPADTKLTEPIAGDEGGRGTVIVSALEGDEDTLRVNVDKVTRYGNYEAKVALDADDAEAPTMTVKVRVADVFLWPLAVLLLGAALAYWQLKAEEEERPKLVLKNALKRLQKAHAEDHKADGTVPYDLDVFPSDWDDCTDPSKEAHKLFCRISSATLKEDLDDIQKAIADLDARVTLWPVSRAKVGNLIDARKLLPADKAADAIRAKAKVLETRSEAPADEAATKAYQKQVDSQVEAIQTWIAASGMLREASMIHRRLVRKRDRDQEIVRRHNPARWEQDLETAADADDLDRCGVFDALCRDLHVLRSLDLTSPPPPSEPEDEEVDVLVTVPNVAEFRARVRPLGSRSSVTRMFMAEERVDVEIEEAPSDETPPPAPRIPAGPSHLEPAPSISASSLEGLKAADRRSFWLTASVATLVYFIGIYDSTFGSLTDYLTAFGAGAGSMYVANFKLLPWFRSYRPPKAS